MIAARKLLDHLMGAERNLTAAERARLNTRSLPWNDPSVCPYFTAGLCPYQALAGTKSDTGQCRYAVHDDECRRVFMQLPPRDRVQYEMTLRALLHNIIAAVNTRVHEQRKQNELVAVITTDRTIIKTAAENATAPPPPTPLQGTGADDVVNSVRSIGVAREDGEVSIGKQMYVCEICGSSLVKGDADSRMAAHMAGKQHSAFESIRLRLSELDRCKEEYAQQNIDTEVKPISAPRYNISKTSQPNTQPPPSSSRNIASHRHDRLGVVHDDRLDRIRERTRDDEYRRRDDSRSYDHRHRSRSRSPRRNIEYDRRYTQR